MESREDDTGLVSRVMNLLEDAQIVSRSEDPEQEQMLSRSGGLAKAHGRCAIRPGAEGGASVILTRERCLWKCRLPFDCQGWPRLELVVRGSDAHGRHRLAGYGSWALPTTAGSIEDGFRA
eukprot:s3032_g6.t1